MSSLVFFILIENLLSFIFQLFYRYPSLKREIIMQADVKQVRKDPLSTSLVGAVSHVGILDKEEPIKEYALRP
jgi:hypothetical protein